MTSLEQAEVEPDESAAPEPSKRSVGWLRDCLVCLAFVLLAAWLTRGLWPDPARRVLALNQQDQVLYEWLLANDARVLFGDVGLLADRLNAPDGVNLMANTSVIALGLLLAPVTLGFGAPITFALLVGGNLALTAVAWYFLYTRVLGASRTAAALGAGLCGFAPGIVSQSNGHLHMTAQWLVPVLVWLLVRLLRAADPDRQPSGRAAGVDVRRIITSALGLAIVAVVQVFIGEEVLFLAGITLALLASGFAVLRPAAVRRTARGFAAGMLLAVGLALVVLAYPLWFQFAGPQGVQSGLFDPQYFSADRASWLAFSPLSVAGGPSSAHLPAGAAEYTTFLGWPLLLVVLGCGIWLLRQPLAIVCIAAAIVMADLSLGPQLVVNGVRSAIPGPYVVLTDVPLFESALPTRFALAVVPLLATVLVLAVDRARRAGCVAPGARDPAGSLTGRVWSRRSVRVLVPGLVVAALAPIFPTPLPTADRMAPPEFITAGHWRECVPTGGVLVPVPLPTPDQPWAMRWGAAANAEFGIPEGLFIGPYGRDGNASMGRYPQPTSALLDDVARTGTLPRIDDGRRRQARLDLAAWHASCVVLDPAAGHTEALRATLQALLGPGRRIADVWAWPV